MIWEGTPTTLMVDPEELRGAASKITGADLLADKPLTTGFAPAAAGIAGTDSQPAIEASGDAASAALEVMTGRLQEWGHVLTTSAADYKETDALAAERLAALGDFNQRPR